MPSSHTYSRTVVTIGGSTEGSSLNNTLFPRQKDEYKCARRPSSGKSLHWWRVSPREAIRPFMPQTYTFCARCASNKQPLGASSELNAQSSLFPATASEVCVAGAGLRQFVRSLQTPTIHRKGGQLPCLRWKFFVCRNGNPTLCHKMQL